MSDTPHRKTGRPNLGQRVEMTVRVPPELRDAVREAARGSGVSENQLLQSLIAGYFGMHHLTPRLPRPEELPLQRSA